MAISLIKTAKFCQPVLIWRTQSRTLIRLEEAGTVQNTLSDGHGGGSDPLNDVNQANAEP